MEKYRYIRKTVTWNHHRYEVRGKTEQEACDKLADLITTPEAGGPGPGREQPHRGPVVRPMAGHLQGAIGPHPQKFRPL